MPPKRTFGYLATLTIILGIIHTAYPIRPSALLKRALLRKRLLQIPSSLRPKRQLFREDIPHHRPLTGNTYYLHAGFPHPSRWHDGPQTIPPNPNPITHHHFHEKPGLHDDLHNNNLQNQHEGGLFPHDHEVPLHPLEDPYPPPPPHLQHGGGEGEGGPVTVSQVHKKAPHTVNIHSSIVHSNGAIGGEGGHGSIGNSLGSPHPPQSPLDQANFDDPSIPPHDDDFEQLHDIPGHGKTPSRKPPKPHSEPDIFAEFGPQEGDYEYPLSYDHHDNHVDPHSRPPPPSHHNSHHGDVHPHPPPDIHSYPHIDITHHQKQPERKPKTIIHYHPISVGNIINFGDDQKPKNNYEHKPGSSYGPPDHIPGVPLSHKEVLSAISQPFINSPYKSVSGSPEFLDYNSESQYGPPNHTPGSPLGSVDLSPMLPSFGPPIKEDPLPPYGVALPVIAHLHHNHNHNAPFPHHPPQHHYHDSPPPSHIHHHHHGPPHRHPPPKRPRGGRSRHHHHVHLHHIHHPPAPLTVEHHSPVHVVNGHVPDKLVSMHSPNFRSHAYNNHPKSFWGL